MSFPVGPVIRGIDRGAAAESARRNGQFIIINLCGGGVFKFEYFPTAPISLERRANWEEQDTTTGTKPLFYRNRDPRRPEVGEVYLDKSWTNESITPQMDELLALQDESCEGTPPPLLIVWGDRQERAVLEDIRFEEILHLADGTPTRARVHLSFKELQQDGIGR